MASYDHYAPLKTTSVTGPLSKKSRRIAAAAGGGGDADAKVKAEKDLRKGWARVKGKIFAAKDALFAWCDCEHMNDMCAEPATLETLEDAIIDTDAEVVEHCCDLGVNVNEPIDETGYTVLDRLATEYIQMHDQAQAERVKGIGPDLLTEMFIDHHHAYDEIAEILKKHNARLSGFPREPNWKALGRPKDDDDE